MKMIIGGILMAEVTLGSFVSFTLLRIMLCILVLGVPGAIIFWLDLREEDVEARKKGWK